MDTLREEYRFTRARKAQTKSWVSFASGYSGIYYATSFGRGGFAGVELSINRQDSDWNKSVFDAIERDGLQSLEDNLDGELRWERLENRQVSRIAAVKPGSIDDEPQVLLETKEWMVQTALRFKQVFDPILSDLVGRQQ